MPIYEYRRPDGSTFEVMQGFSEEPLTHDPDNDVPVERVLHAPAVHFKGKGFYNTDYGTRKRQRESAAPSDGASSEGAASTSGSGTSENGSSGSSGSSSEKGAAPKAKESKPKAEKLASSSAG